MPFSLSSSTLTQEFFLVNADKLFDNQDLPSRIEIRCLSIEGEKQRNELLRSVIWKEVSENNFRYTFDLSSKEVWLMEAYLTLADCNICETDGEPLFRFKDKKISMSEEEFQLAWGRLPHEYTDEIIKYVHEKNPQWKMNNG